MKINKLGNILLIIFVLLMIINVVSAEDNTLVGTENGKLMVNGNSDSALSLADANDGAKLGATNSYVTLKAGEVGNYTELQSLIDANPNGVITLGKNYAYSDGDSNWIQISHSITINGNGYKISGENKKMSFYIPAGTGHVTLNNITFINGKGNSMLWINGNDCLINNCTFEHNNASKYGGAVRMSGQFNVINNSKFIDNFATEYGGAVYLGGNHNTINGSTFENGDVGLYGGGAVCVIGHNLLIDNSTFKRNKAQYGGAVYLNGYDNLVNNSTFENNNADYGGAVYFAGYDNLVNGSTIEYNHAMISGAIYMSGHDNTLNNSVINHNIADSVGGAIYIAGSNLTIDESKFNENSVNAVQASGAAIRVDGNNVEILNSEFNKHDADQGGAIHWIGANGTISDSNFTENSAQIFGGAVYWEGVNGTVNGCEFNENDAKNSAGAIYITKDLLINDTKFNKNTAGNFAGAISIETDNVTVIHSEFNQNHAKQAGAIKISGRNNTIESSEFNDNNATEESPYGVYGGGAILISQPEMYSNELLNNTIRASTFNRNGARAGGAILISSKGNTINGSNFYYNSAIFGGAVYINHTDNNVIDDSLFEHNTASESGGALSIIFSDNIIVNNARMNRNNATVGGAIYVYPSDDVTVNNSHFVQNGAYNNVADILPCGGAVYWFGDNGIIDNSEFYNNRVNIENWSNTHGGAVYFHGDNALINNSKFTYNWAYNKDNFSDGGALYLDGNYTTVENSLFEDNMAIAYGGAIYLEGYAGSVYNSTFNRNRVGTEGGALYVNSEDFVINKSTFTKNNATYLGGAVALDEPGTIDNSTFTENTANKGGAIYWDAPEGTLNNSNFYNNSAYYAGGAFSCDYYYPHAEKLIENCLFEENSCHNYGGAIASLNSEIVNSTFKNNRAHIGEAVHSFSSKISPDSKFENNDVVIQTTELIQINRDDSIGNSTRKTNTSYTAVCIERFTQFPHLGLKDDSLSRVINILTGDSIADYLKILVSTYFNSTDDIYRYKDEKILFYSEADRDNPDHWNKLVYIPRIDYFSRAVHEFSDHDFWNSDHPLVVETLRLYKSVYGNGTKIPEKFIKEVNGSLVEFDFSSMISPTSQSLFLFKMIKHNMSVQKIVLNKTVYLGNQTMFKIVVTNNGESNLTDIKVKEAKYDGLKLVNYVADNLWTGNIQTGEFIYSGILKPGDNASFIVIFDTLKKGNLTNVVVASNNKTTNKTANNTTEAVPIRVNVTKIWDDVNNYDGLRPNSVIIYLFADGKKINETVLSEKNNWNFIFNDLPMVKNGKIINYTVSEKPIEGYTMKIINKTVDDFTIVIANNTYIFTVNNTHTIGKTNINVTKVWNDDNNRDGIRPVKVIVNLLANGEIYQTIELNESNKWNYYFTNLYVYKDGKKIKYNFSEEVNDKYTVSYTNSTTENFTITNTHIPEKTSVNVTKVWIDADNQDGIRPSSITVVLSNDTSKVAEYVLNDSNNWKHTFTDLPVYNNGQQINYTIEEVTIVDNYKSEVTKNTAYNWTITNTHTPAVTKLNVTKIWNDANNQDGIRPSSITVVLSNDTSKVAEYVLNDSNNWKHTFTDLPVYNNGQQINYTIEEVTIVDNYKSEVTKNTAYNWTITNTHTPAVTKLNVTKIWNDANNQDGIRPSSITVVLSNDTSKVAEYVLNDSNNWKHTFTDLPVYNNGQQINYTIEEVTIVDNYKSEVTKNTAYNWTITNTHTPAVTKLNVTKIWIDANNQDGIRPSSITVVLSNDTSKVAEYVLNDSNNWKHTFTDLPVYNNGQQINYTIEEVTIVDNYKSEVTKNTAYNWTITNTHTPAVTKLNVTKIWIDANNQDGIRPSSITVVLSNDTSKVAEYVLNDSNNWKHTFTDLPVYNNGQQINYTIEEVTIVDNYKSEVTKNTAYNWTITNTHTPAVTKLNVTKIWNDANNQDGIRPSSITVVLSNDTSKVAEYVLNDSNNWKHTFTDLPVYNNGQQINYTIEEVTIVDNYKSEVTKNTAYNWTITNTHTPAVTKLNVTKIWNDANNQDGIRPSSITVVLSNDTSKVAEYVLNDSNNWKHTFTDLPVYNNGQQINYTIEEVTIVDNYKSEVTKNTAYNWTITNTHTPAVTKLNVTKIWNDANNQDGIRPSSVNVILIANSDVVGTATLDNSNNWKHTFTDLPVYNNGQQINYTIEEVTIVDNYKSEVTKNTAYNWTITNTHTPAVTKLNVTKIWIDANNQDGIRPSSVNVILIANSDVVGTATLDNSNNWKHTFENLPIYNNGTLIEYSIEEISVNNYTSAVSKDSAYNFTVTNVHTPAITVVNITKVWGNSDKKDEKPVVIVIYADGIEIVNATLFPGKNSKFTFDDLPIYKDGNKINYTIRVVDGNRTVNFTKTEGNFTIIIEPEYHPNMSVQKITLDKKVKVEEQVSFRIVVKNTGDCNLTGVYVIDREYSEGLVFDHMLPNNDWTYVGDGKFVYGKTLGVGETASFIVVFNTTSVGFKVNSVIAGNNITNNTVNSTNTTRVVNDTVPPEPKNHTTKHPVHHKHHVPKHIKQDKYATGNPITLLLLALLIPLIRRKQK